MRQIGVVSTKPIPWSKIIFLTLLLLAATIAIIKIFNLENLLVGGPKSVVQLITDTGLKSDNGRVNVLLLGIGGEGHEGPNLTDTMILASIDKTGKDVVLISIPRDLWAPSFSAKVNAAYAFGQESKEGGLSLAKKTIRQLFDLPIHYAVRIDFNGFEKAIDQVDGIDLDVEKSFVDSQYPIPGKEDDTCGIEIETKIQNGARQVYFKDATGSAVLLTEDNDPFVCRYETVEFAQGPTHMDGTTALKFVRSRHGTNGEGSDFARSARSQKVILAFRQKVLSSQTLLNPKTIVELVNTFGKSIDTDIESDDVPLFVKLVPKIDPSTIRRVVLDEGRQNSVLDVGDPTLYAGQFVLDPKSNNWHDLAEYVQGEIFKLEEK